MEILSTSDSDLEKAAAALAGGLLVAFPTETVYGLGADAFNPSAIARIFEAKNRPHFDPLIIHIAEMEALFRVINTAKLNDAAKERLSVLSQKLWPGPLTLILPKRNEIPGLATAGLPTAAVRFPSHPAAQKLILLSTGAIAAPSANPFGCLSPTRAEHVKAMLGEKADYIIDGGKTLVGIESTVLDLSRDPPRILRPGGTPREAIEALIGAVELSLPFLDKTQENNVTPLSPGQLKSHYAPRTPLVLYRRGELASLTGLPGESREGREGREGRLFFTAPQNAAREDSAPGKSSPETRILSKTGDLREAAANLFDMLHELDSLGLHLIRAEEAPENGLGIAINDRLRRAADRG